MPGRMRCLHCSRALLRLSVQTSAFTLELVRIEAKRYGVNVVGSEIVGLVPMGAMVDSASYYMGLENFSAEQVLEARIME